MSFSEQDRICMQLVIDKTRAGVEKGNWPFGACIAMYGQPIVVTYNIVLETHDPSAHAEVNAIRQACKQLNTIDLSGYEIYTSCAPCPMCFSAIYWSGIRRIIYGAFPEDYSVLGFISFIVHPEKMAEISHVKLEIKGGLLREENQALFDLYYAKYGKVY